MVAFVTSKLLFSTERKHTMAYQFFDNTNAQAHNYMIVDIDLLFDQIIPHDVKMAYFALQNFRMSKTEKYENVIALIMQMVMRLNDGQARKLLGELVRWGLLIREETEYKGVFKYTLVPYEEYEQNDIYEQRRQQLKRKEQRRKNAKLK